MTTSSSLALTTPASCQTKADQRHPNLLQTADLVWFDCMLALQTSVPGEALKAQSKGFTWKLDDKLQAVIAIFQHLQSVYRNLQAKPQLPDTYAVTRRTKEDNIVLPQAFSWFVTCIAGDLAIWAPQALTQVLYQPTRSRLCTCSSAAAPVPWDIVKHASFLETPLRAVGDHKTYTL